MEVVAEQPAPPAPPPVTTGEITMDVDVTQKEASTHKRKAEEDIVLEEAKKPRMGAFATGLCISSILIFTLKTRSQFL